MIGVLVAWLLLVAGNFEPVYGMMAPVPPPPPPPPPPDQGRGSKRQRGSSPPESSDEDDEMDLRFCKACHHKSYLRKGRCTNRRCV